MCVQDGDVRKAFQRALTKQGFKFKLGVKVNSAKVEGDTVVLDTEAVKGGKKETMKADIVLVSAGEIMYLFPLPLDEFAWQFHSLCLV